MTEDLNQQVSEALKAIARNEDIKNHLLNEPKLYKVILKSAERFIAGESLDDCIKVAKSFNNSRHLTTIDFMGESSHSRLIIDEAIEEFCRVIDSINKHNLKSSVSFDLSHIGLSINSELALESTQRIASKASKNNIELMISMEGSERTDLILDVYEAVCNNFPNVGITVQANLYRTDEDIERMIRLPGKIRLVKGAFQEKENIARRKGMNVNEAYQQYLSKILATKHKCSIATHDENMIKFAIDFINEKNISGDLVEFEMLKGVTLERLNKIKDLGFKTRVYLPYGKEWYLYLCHRLAEYPPNVYQSIIDAIELSSNAALAKVL